MAKYYVITLSCGCSFTSGTELLIGSAVECQKHHCYSTVVDCKEYTTM